MRTSSIETLHPVYFSLAMATGIVSIAAHFEGFDPIAHFLLWVNVGAYCVLWVLYLMRAFRYPKAFFGDLFVFPKGVGYFTIVAATCVLGSQVNLVGGNPVVAGWLWLFGLLLLPTVFYTIFTCYTVARQKPDLGKGINGGWLVSVVSCQGVSLLGSQLASHFQPWQEIVMFIALITWLMGAMLYIWIISLIFYRSLFLLMEPAEYASPYWINMGAAAISVLAGSLLVLNAENSALVGDVVVFIKGFTLFFWATATAWIPQLLLLGVWRFVIRRVPFTYSPMDWGMVFPLGMYTVCTHMLAKAVDTGWLEVIPNNFVYLAFIAWLATALNYLRSWAAKPAG